MHGEYSNVTLLLACTTLIFILLLVLCSSMSWGSKRNSVNFSHYKAPSQDLQLTKMQMKRTAGSNSSKLSDH
ncbi:hypothetical protein GDO86_010608 [Hymenochirus boettgeri]|uniref:Uncharacterized protein n=1 Tax=Hymenochirus boettgeri TaxID=247094 RepID=A0A8T2JR66_9PIPI|nr:hypothetical protein GDO86_010608 [Hymenochirus boettgeri]